MRSGVLDRQLKQGQVPWRGLPEQDAEPDREDPSDPLEQPGDGAVAGMLGERGGSGGGHENLNTTRIYTPPSVHDLTEAVERLEGE